MGFLPQNPFLPPPSPTQVTGKLPLIFPIAEQAWIDHTGGCSCNPPREISAMVIAQAI
ncbi:MAG: hypothetical protein HC862_11050 [Scytonema sp. RU_4_4]|nr:hypothetical protein [Scytonema sp. RU_4_4]